MRRRVVVAALLATSAASAAPAQNPRLAALPPNTAVDLGVYDCQNPAGAGGHCASITDYSGMVYDRHHHRLMMFGGGHAGTSGTIRSDVSVFDFGTLRWSSNDVATSCADMNVANIDTTTGSWRTTGQPLARHTYDMLVMLDDPPQMLMTTSGAVGGETCSGGPPPSGFELHTRIAGYDPETKKWSYRATSPEQWDSYSSAEFDPVSGATIILGAYGLWAYDAKNDAFLGSQFVPTELGYANNLVYAKNTDRMYYFARGEATRVFELTLDRATWKASTLTELTGVVGPKSDETGYAYDEVNRVLGGGILDGKFTAFDPVAKTWTTRTMETDPPGAQIGSMAFHEIAYDPVDGVFVFLTNLAAGVHVWAYRYAGVAPAPPTDADGGRANDPTSGSAPAAAGGSTATTSTTNDGGGCGVTGAPTNEAAVLALLLPLVGRRRRRA